MNFRRLLFITVAVLVACWSGWAQQKADYVRSVAIQAQQLGHGLPVVPASALLPGSPGRSSGWAEWSQKVSLPKPG